VAEGLEGLTGGQIQTFTASGTPVSVFSTIGSYTFSQPNGVAYSSYNGNIYVVDQVNNAVYEINPAGPTLVGSGPLTTWTSTGGDAPSSFSGPEGIAVDASGNVYVADTGNDYVEVFHPSLSSAPVTEFGGSGSGNGEFNNPSAVAIDGSGNIYVADASNPQTGNNQRVQIFSSSYAYSSQFSIGADSDIYGMALSGGNIYLADSGTGQVEEYSTAGVFLTAGLGISPTHSPSPDSLVFIGSNLLVGDYNNNQLYLVTP
jgi:DNA-binding beta-propeller fold protein YncE